MSFLVKFKVRRLELLNSLKTASMSAWVLQSIVVFLSELCTYFSGKLLEKEPLSFKKEIRIKSFV